MGNFRDNLKKAFVEGFTVDQLYASHKYNAKILKEIDPNTSDDENAEDLDLNDPTEDAPDETGKETGKKDEAPAGDDSVSDSPEAGSDDVETSVEPDNEPDKNEPKKRPTPDEITPPTPITPIETPEQKIERMFTDTGDVDIDYANTNENNIRLASFKFENAGIVLDKVLTEDDLKGGISVRDIENRLTPEQTDLFKSKNKELRRKYPLIDKREKMCLIYNAHVPMTKRDEQYNSIPIDKDQRKQAFDKLNAYMEEHFAPNWQDKQKYVNFLKTIKVNFSDKPAIRSNLINTTTFINEDSSDIIPLDKVYADIPKSIQELLLDNSEDPNFVKSNIFRTLNSSFNQEVASSSSMYVIINSENIKLGDGTPEENVNTPPGDDTDEIGIGDDESAEDKPEEGGDDLPDDDGLEPPPETDDVAEPEGAADPVGTDVEI